MHLMIKNKKKKNKNKNKNLEQEILNDVNQTMKATRKNRKEMYKNWQNTFSFTGVPVLLV